MEWLEAALAFAVVMMALSTVVTAILELIHRVFNLREAGLRRIMEIVYGNFVQPRLVELTGKAHAGQSSFVDHMTNARYRPGNEASNWIQKVLHSSLNTKQLNHLTTLEFIERLAETPEGRMLWEKSKQRGEAYLEIFLKDLASKYEDVGESAREYFMRRSRAVTMAISVALTLFVNINAVTLFDTLVTNKDLRDSWIKEGEQVAAQLNERQAELDRLLKQTQTEPDGEKQLMAITQNIEQIRNMVHAQSDKGIPIGWKFAPWKSTTWEDTGILAGLWLRFKWLIGVLLAGLLIGLGGPFWFDTFKKLSAVTGLARGLQSKVQKAKEPGQTVAETGVVDSELVEIFQTAAIAHAIGVTGGRALLTPDGNIDKEN
jgi:hypothetical protein